MMVQQEKQIGNWKVCPEGHRFRKSTDCPTCPVCEEKKKPAAGFLSKLSSPARNALLHAGIDSLKKLSQYAEKEVLSLHGMGPKSLPVLREALREEGLHFRKNE